MVRAVPTEVWSTPSSLTCARPGSDPNPPHGEIDLLPPATLVTDVNVTLDLTAEDDPTTEEHLPFDGAILDPLSSASGVAHKSFCRSVITQPGTTVLTRIRCGPRSRSLSL